MPKFIEYYGYDGPIQVNTSGAHILDTWMEAGRELGYSFGDPNGYLGEGNFSSLVFPFV